MFVCNISRLITFKLNYNSGYAEALLAAACLTDANLYSQAWDLYNNYNLASGVQKVKVPIQWIYCGTTAATDEKGTSAIYRIPVEVQNATLRTITIKEPSQLDFTYTGKGYSY